ncbi:MAG: hypothetical protein AB7P94_17690 [Steroidobacteraceae bacterium]
MSQQINLFNPLFLRKEKYFSARTMAQSLGLIVLGLVALWGYALVQTRGLQRVADEYGQQLAAQRDQFVRLGTQGSSKLLEAEIARLQADVRARQGLLGALADRRVGDADGYSRYFAAFARYPMRGVWLTGFSVGEGGNALRLRGRVLHPDLVPEYLKALNDADVMRGRLVTELKLVAHDESTARRAGTGVVDPGPERFVEFDLLAPLRSTALPNAATAGAGR